MTPIRCTSASPLSRMVVGDAGEVALFPECLVRIHGCITHPVIPSCRGASMFESRSIRPSLTQDLGDCGHGIPVARRDRHPEEPVEHAEVADGFHVAPVQAEDEPVVPREDSQQPRAAGRKAHGHRRRRAGASGQDAHEAYDVGSHGLVREMILRHQPDNLATLADHDLRIKGKPGCQFGAELRPGDRLPDHEGARRADVDRIEVLQLFGERGRPEGSVTTDVDPSQKNDECHQVTPRSNPHPETRPTTRIVFPMALSRSTSVKPAVARASNCSSCVRQSD